MARVMLLGPERERAAGIRSLLRQEGHQINWQRSTQDWREREREIKPDLIVAAVASNEEILGAARSARAGFAAPILFVQQESDFFRDLHADSRLVDRLASPFMGEELLARVDALVRVRQIVTRGSAPSSKSGGVRQRARAWLLKRFPKSEMPVGPYLEVASRVAEWADRRDAFEPGHAERVSTLCAIIAEGLNMEQHETSELLRAAMLHDIGKVALPVDVLHHQGPLQESQKRLIRTHPARGAALLRALDPDQQVARVVLLHHERPDGTGYYGKAPENVPQSAWVLSVAEAYDAMTSSLLRQRLTPEAALELLESSSGTVYDKDCVDALTQALRARRATIPLSPVSRTHAR